MKAVVVAVCACLPLFAVAGQNDAAGSAENGQIVEVSHYDYGMDLDVQHVISIQRQAGATCAVTPVDMVYEDSKGQTHTVEYLNAASGCNNG